MADLSRSVSQTVTVSDAGTKVLTEGQWVIQQVTITESVTVRLSGERVTAASAQVETSPTDSGERITDIVAMVEHTPLYTAAESVSVSDTATVELSSPLPLVSVSEDTTVSDTATVEVTSPTMSVSDGTTVTDAATVELSSPSISVSDGTTVTDSVSALSSGERITSMAVQVETDETGGSGESITTIAVMPEYRSSVPSYREVTTVAAMVETAEPSYYRPPTTRVLPEKGKHIWVETIGRGILRNRR